MNKHFLRHFFTSTPCHFLTKIHEVSELESSETTSTHDSMMWDLGRELAWGGGEKVPEKICINKLYPYHGREGLFMI